MKNLYFRKILFLAAGIFITASISIAQTVEINYIPPVGQGGIAEGQVVWNELTAANAGQYAVIAILRADWGDDYVKPTWDNYLSEVDASGNFFINITTNTGDYSQPNYNFYFVERSTFNGVAGSTIKSWNMSGKYLGAFAAINRNDFWAAKLHSPVPSIRPGFVPAGSTITLNQPVETDAVIRFTLDGSDPVTSSTADTYSGQTFSVPSSGALLVKAVVTKDGKYSYPSNMTWIAYEAPSSDCTLFGLNVSLALNGEVFGYQLSKEETQARIAPMSHLTQWIRTFGTLGNGLEYVNEIAKQMNLRTMTGVFISSDISKNNGQLQGLRNILQTGKVDLITVGNECNNPLLATYVSPKIVSDYIDSVRNIVQSYNLIIPIGTVDIGNTAYFQLILQKIDFRGVNLYPGTHDATPELQMFDQLKASWNNELSNTPSMMVCLTETGTPYAGGSSAGGTQTASEAKAVTYLENVIAWTKKDTIPCFYFEAYDEPAKGTGIERYFGLMDGNLEVHSFYKDILCLTATNMIETKTDLKFFPNPTKGVVYLETDSKINIYNAQGALLQKTAGKQIDLSAYPAGIYLLKVNDEMYKIVKQ